MERSCDTAERLLFKLAEEAIYKCTVHQTKEDLATSCPSTQTKCFRCWKTCWVLPYYSSIFAADNTVTIESGKQKMPKKPKKPMLFQLPKHDPEMLEKVQERLSTLEIHYDYLDDSV